MPNFAFEPAENQKIINYDELRAFLEPNVTGPSQFSDSIVSLMWSFGRLSDTQKVALAHMYGHTKRYIQIAQPGYIPLQAGNPATSYMQLKYYLGNYSDLMFALEKQILKDYYYLLSAQERAVLRSTFPTRVTLLEQQPET